MLYSYGQPTQRWLPASPGGECRQRAQPPGDAGGVPGAS